jgi:hypothetical protein
MHGFSIQSERSVDLLKKNVQLKIIYTHSFQLMIVLQNVFRIPVRMSIKVIDFKLNGK